MNDFWAKRLGFEVIGNIIDNAEMLEEKKNETTHL